MDVAGAIAEYGTKVSTSMAESLQTLSSTLQQSAQSAGQRAELARSAWQTLDQLSSSALASHKPNRSRSPQAKWERWGRLSTLLGGTSEASWPLQSGGSERRRGCG